MLRNRIYSLLGLLMLTVVSVVNGQILKGLEKYQYAYTTAEQFPKEAMGGIMIGISPIEPEKYISTISSVEVASCYEEKDVKKFIKTARKLIKKEHISRIKTINSDCVVTELYAKEGEIIVLSVFDDFAGIFVIK